MKRDDVLEILEEVTKIYFDYNCTLLEAIERAKEVIKDDGQARVSESNSRTRTSL